MALHRMDVDYGRLIVETKIKRKRNIMGRSVETSSSALSVTYTTFEPEPDDEFEWDCFVEDIQEYLPTFYPSLEKADDWLCYPYQETAIILQNEQVNICLSEYCGVWAIQVIPREDRDDSALAKRNGTLIGDRIESIWGQLKKLGSFSNGEVVFASA